MAELKEYLEWAKRMWIETHDFNYLHLFEHYRLRIAEITEADRCED